MYIVEALNVTKVYGSGEVSVHALRGVDLQMRRGEVLVIMGPSGSGKSTLLHLLGGIDVPTEGRVLLEGTDLAALDDRQRSLIRRQKIGFVFQTFNLLPTLTAEENVALPLVIDGVPARQSQRRVEEVLELTSLAHRRKHVPGALSGGEQQRVAIARALVINPVMLLADEPTGALDTATGRQVMALLRRLADELKHTIVIVTHDAEVAAQADRMVRLRDGLVDTA
jgi:putative ABC transport system ATP-binding protein